MVSQLETPILSGSALLSASSPHAIEGLVQVFTCPHRSFFTNVIAQALRLAGQGTSVLIVQFLKGGINQGHDRPVELGQHLHWLRCNLPRCIDAPDLNPIEAEALQSLWQHTKTVVDRGDYALVVLDELSLAIEFGLIAESDVLEFLSHRPSQVDVILTGPEVPSAILNIADQITEMRRTQRSSYKP